MPTRSSIGSLLASRRRRREGEPAGRPRIEEAIEGLRTRLARSGETAIEGHVFDPADPERRFCVELLLDGLPAALARAELFVPALAGDDAAIGDGCHGFVFALDPAVLPTIATLSVRIANTDDLVGAPIDLQAGEAFAPPQAPVGAAEWIGGLRIAGWVRRDDAAAPPRIEARFDDAAFAAVLPDHWRIVERGGVETAEPGFELTLPASFADGRFREIEILAGGRALPGSPVAVLAFADGIRDALGGEAEVDADTIRLDLFERWFPAAAPFEALAEWERRFPAEPVALPEGESLAVAVIGEDGAEATLRSAGLDRLPDWIGAILPARGLGGGFEPRDLADFLEGDAAGCAVLLLLPAGASARPGGPDALAAALLAHPAASVATGDVLVRVPGGAPAPLALPAFDYERALEQGCAAGVLAIRTEAALEAARRGAGDLDRLFLAPLDRGASGRATHLHVPGFGFTVTPRGAAGAETLTEAVRAHLTERGLPAEVEPRPPATLPAVRVRRAAPRSSLTLVVDAGRSEAEIEACLEALDRTRTRTALTLVVAAPPISEALARRLALAGVALSPTPFAASPARRIGDAVAGASSDLVAFLDARLVPEDDGWLEELLGRLSDPGAGLAAPTLLSASGLVAEAGLVLDLTQAPRPAFRGESAGNPGFGDACLVARQVAAVGPACLVTRRADFVALGGFDPLLFPRHLGAADYALKLQALGRRIVVTPDAMLRFAADALSRGPLEEAALDGEMAALRARWAPVLAADPFYSPLLQRGGRPFGGLASPPGERRARHSLVAVPRAVAPGWR